MTSEQHALIGDAEHIARNKIKPVMVRLLENIVLECGAEKMTFISIVMPDELIAEYPEVKRYHKARRVVEARVQLPFYEFKEADSVQQVGLLLDALVRSIDMVGKIKSLKLTRGDYHMLKSTVEKARVQLVADLL
ncbi:hypothetical protein RTH46_16285 [Pseudomonas sp. zfem004]|uniref:hypothetical protein n=1 Tax=Pseudomonas sp. zfem004 TaxID=3078199 RepID=UPI002928287C|nr:hypothetical protein [Pseudomonas sp. zfem004]MDU9404049.1 hypothetical protein [Pseudomonas sp. zfem004]